MNKNLLLQRILAQLEADLLMARRAAQTAYEAATHEENIAENKYDTLGLEASYLAAGQARRVSEISQALHSLQQLPLRAYDAQRGIQLGALVLLEDDQGGQRWLFLAPDAAGLKVQDEQREILLITPQSPLGQHLLGQAPGAELSLQIGSSRQHFEVIEVY